MEIRQSMGGLYVFTCWRANSGREVALGRKSRMGPMALHSDKDLIDVVTGACGYCSYPAHQTDVSAELRPCVGTTAAYSVFLSKYQTQKYQWLYLDLQRKA